MSHPFPSQFERSLLRWLEYPPDANHGFYLPSATITTRLRDNKNASLLLAAEDSTMSYSLWGNPAVGSGDVLRIYTETLLVSLPTPDFSMPYNVICLVRVKPCSYKLVVEQLMPYLQCWKFQACTVAALAFGPIHNITTKTLELVQVCLFLPKYAETLFAAGGGREGVSWKTAGQVKGTLPKEASCGC